MKMKYKDKLKKEAERAFQESDLAWEEFFKDKPKPKSEEEDRKQQEEYYYWYNFVRKQSDTGKTPAEMYKEVYGEEPSKENIDLTKVSRIMNFGWDEDYNEEEFDEEDEDFHDDNFNPLSRTCPECNIGELEVTGDLNIYECGTCGSIWKRLKPLNDGTGNMINLPEKLKRLLGKD